MKRLALITLDTRRTVRTVITNSFCSGVLTLKVRPAESGRTKDLPSYWQAAW